MLGAERHRAVLSAGTAAGSAGVVALMMHLDAWLLVVLSVSAAASVWSWATTSLGLAPSLRRTRLLGPGSGLTDDEHVELTTLAAEFGPSAISSARRIIDDEVDDRWLVELAHQRLDRVANPAAEHRRRTTVIIGLFCLACVATIAWALTRIGSGH